MPKMTSTPSACRAHSTAWAPVILCFAMSVLESVSVRFSKLGLTRGEAGPSTPPAPGAAAVEARRYTIDARIPRPDASSSFISPPRTR
jgi:hypothetical protein